MIGLDAVKGPLEPGRFCDSVKAALAVTVVEGDGECECDIVTMPCLLCAASRLRKVDYETLPLSRPIVFCPVLRRLLRRGFPSPLCGTTSTAECVLTAGLTYVGILWGVSWKSYTKERVPLICFHTAVLLLVTRCCVAEGQVRSEQSLPNFIISHVIEGFQLLLGLFGLAVITFGRRGSPHPEQLVILKERSTETQPAEGACWGSRRPHSRRIRLWQLGQSALVDYGPLCTGLWCGQELVGELGRVTGEKAGQDDVQKLRVWLYKTCARHCARVTGVSGAMLFCRGVFEYASCL